MAVEDSVERHFGDCVGDGWRQRDGKMKAETKHGWPGQGRELADTSVLFPWKSCNECRALLYWLDELISIVFLQGCEIISDY
mmetsp:Transcript_18248/g.43909  ORF Transcript_18248/g.43909 Transcript_18248/m.43909 type:complete len:82 (+) Transcript_18248:1043-1288(+)